MPPFISKEEIYVMDSGYESDDEPISTDIGSSSDSYPESITSISSLLMNGGTI